jgi:hypothetical protein
MPTPGRQVLLERLVRAMPPAVIGVLAEDQPQPPFAADRHPVQAQRRRAFPSGGLLSI